MGTTEGTRTMGRHTAPRTRTPFWTLGIGAVAAGMIVSGTLATAPLTGTTIDGTPHAEAQPAVSAVCGTDAECAQWSLEHGQALGYGADAVEHVFHDRPRWVGGDGYGADAAPVTYDATHQPYVTSDGQPGGYWISEHGSTMLDCDDNVCVFEVGTGASSGLAVVRYAAEQAGV